MCECAKTKMLMFGEQNKLFRASLGENIHWFDWSMMYIKTTLAIDFEAKWGTCIKNVKTLDPQCWMPWCWMFNR